MAIFSGAESVVNLPDGGIQQNARLARGANGGWIAAWQSSEGGTDGFGVFLRLFDASGLGGAEIHVNQKTAANQGEIAVIMLGDSGFLVIWTDMDYGASGEWDIYQRRYDASGTPLSGEMAVNLTTSNMQSSPDVIATPDGGWIVTWTSSGQAGPNTDIFMRRFDSTGADMTGEVLVNTSSLDFSDTPKTTLLASGGWIVSWQRATATGTALFQRQFDSAGIPVGPESVVDSTPGGMDERPVTAGLADGGWIVAWAAFGVDGSGWSICQKRYDAAGNEVLATPLLVNTHTADDQRHPAVASLPNGGWVVVWQSENQDESSFLSASGIYQQVFDIDGNPVGGEMLVNSQIVGNQANPSITALDDGAWIVSWQDDSIGGTDIIQKKFEPIHVAPEGQDTAIDIAAGSPYAFSGSDFPVTDADGDALSSIVITGFVGNLQLDGQAVAIGATINAADLDKMVWDANGGPGGSITFKVIDSGSTAHGGVNMDDDANTITFNVIASTAAIFGGDLAQTISEDESTVISGTATVTDPDPGENAFLAVQAGALNGSHGVFTFDDASGQWSYDLNEADKTIQALGDTDSVTDTLALASADGTTTNLVITIIGVNDAAVISGTLAQTINEDDTATTGGQIAASDPDSGQSGFVAASEGDLTGAFGNFTFTAFSGQWTFDLNETNPDIQALKDGESILQSLTVSSADGTPAEIVVTINGANDAAVISGDLAAEVGEDEAAIIGGIVSVSDADSGEGLFVAVPAAALDGAHGAFTFNEVSGEWSYDLDEADASIQALNAGDTLTDTLTISSADGTPAEIVVTINGANDAAVISGDLAAEVGEDEAAIIGGSLSLSDADSGESLFVAVPAGGLVGAHGAFTFNEVSGQWSYDLAETDASIQALKAGEPLTDTLAISSADGTTAEIVVTINGANDATIISGDLAAEIGEDEAAIIGGIVSVSDADSGEGLFVAVTAAALDGAHGAFTFNEANGQWSYDLDETDAAIQSLKAGETLTDTLAISSADGTTAEIVVTINGAADGAVAGGDLNAVIGEDDSGPVGGAIIVVDPDAGENTIVSIKSGLHGAFSINALTGQWTYELDNDDDTVQSLGEGQILTDIMQVETVDGTVIDISVSITGANDSAATGGIAAANVTEDLAVNASGLLTITDPDQGQAGWQAPADLAGVFGIFTFDLASGAWTYTLDNARPDIQALGTGQSLVDILTVTSVDGTAQSQITVTIAGADEPPTAAVISGTMAATLSEDETGMALGTLDVVDPDAGEDAFAAVPPAQLAGAHGIFTFNQINGQWSYDLDEADATIQSLKAGETLTDWLAVSSIDGTTADIVVTIHGANDAAIIDGELVVDIGEDDSAIISGTASVSDADAGENTFLEVTAAALAGAHGVFSFNQINGQWSYDLDEADAAIQSLKAGETFSDTLAIASVDGTAADIVVTIHGADDAAVMNGELAGNIGEDDSAIISGTASVSDADAGENTFLEVTAAALAGAHGVFSFNQINGQWSYDLDEADAAIQSLKAGETLTDTLPISSADGTAADIVVTIHGADDAAVMNGELAGNIGEDDSAIISGTASVNDADGGESAFLAVTAAALEGAHGVFTFNESNGHWSYDLDEADAAIQSLKAGGTLTDTLAIASVDGTTAEIVVTIHGANDAAVLAGDLAADIGEDESAIIGGTASVSDADGGESAFLAVTAAQLAGTHGVFTFNEINGQWSYDLDEADFDVQSLKAGETLTETLAVTSLDGTAATITVHVAGENDAPVIMPALADLVAKAGDVFLFEAGSHFLDVDRDDLTFSATMADGAALPDWLAFDDATGRFSGTSVDQDAGAISIVITAADGHGGLAADSFDIVIVAQPSTANHAPIVAAAIADQSAVEDLPFEFTLPAESFKDADGDALQLTATLADGSALPQWLAFDTASGRFSGTPLNTDAGKIAILVMASDGVDSVLDVFTLHVANVNDAPTLTQAIADQAGARNSDFSFILPEDLFADIDAGDALTLSAMLGNGDPLPGWLAFDAATASFAGIPGVGDTGVHTVTVTATDMAGASASATFHVVIADINDAPAGTDTAITVDEGSTHVFSAADFGFGDANGNALNSVMIEAIAGRGALSLDGAAVKAGDEIAVGDLGKLTFAPGTDETGADYARISFRVRDDGGTGNGGVDLDPIANIITFAVTDILDVIMGDRSANILDGTEGGDQLSGKGGNDRINAENGMDLLTGGGGKDRLMGGDGADVLNGGKGRDRLTGGEGVDTFLFREHGGVDVILDFDAVEDGGHDMIDLVPLKSITSLDDLMTHHVSVLGADVVIDAGNGDKVILRNVQLSDLDAGDFLF